MPRVSVVLETDSVEGYDVITIRRLDGDESSVFFDVSDFFGLEPV